MRLDRLIYNFDNSDSHLRIIEKELIHQIKNVLRLKIGEKIIFVSGAGREAEALLINTNKNYLDFKLINNLNNNSESKLKVTLYCSILKRENFELVVQKTTEVGIKEIVPIITERTIKLNLRADRINKIIKEAVEQSGRIAIPNLKDVMIFKKAMAYATEEHTINILFDLNGESIESNKLASLLKISKEDSVGIFIGPEGGWSLAEISLAEKSGFKILSLGETTLRAETAAIIASYVVLNLK